MSAVLPDAGFGRRGGCRKMSARSLSVPTIWSKATSFAGAQVSEKGEGMARPTDLQHQLAEHGYSIKAWRPDDGPTRYKIYRVGESYHETNAVTIAFGLAESRAVVSAFLAGLAEGMRRSSSGSSGVSDE